ncbi:MAG TPA: CinA family protein, partial [Rhizomicrobium sp.]
VTGIAGPGGGSAEKPVGLVYISVARGDAASSWSTTDGYEFGDIGRTAVRLKTIQAALNLLDALVEKTAPSRVSGKDDTGY